MKKLFSILAGLSLAVSLFITGCTFSLKGADGVAGRDGKDGSDVTIEAVYQKYLETHGDATFEQFLKEYLSYTNQDLEAAASLRATINRRLFSGVSILTRFSYTSYKQTGFPTTQSTTYKVYTGSGAILWLDKEAGDAYVVTNCHVVYDDTADSIFCSDVRLYLYGQDSSGINYTLSNNNIENDENYRIPAQIVGASVTYDIALLKVTGSEILKRNDAVAVSNKAAIAEAINDSFVQDGNSLIGDTVFAIGNASGEGMSATDGIVSKDSEYIDVGLSEANKDKVESYRVLRTTAPINHGNSGGALYNSSGKIVGIVNAKDEGADIDNMGYALPANCVRRLLISMYDSYKSGSSTSATKRFGVNKAYLNVRTQVCDSYARLNASGFAEITELVKIDGIEGTPARGKLEVGDILISAKIVSSDGKIKENVKINRQYTLTELLLAVRVGDTLTLAIERGGISKDVTIKFDGNYFKYFE